MLVLVLVLAGCTSPYSVRVAGHAMTARPGTDSGPTAGVYATPSDASPGELEPVPEAIVSIAPCFGKKKGSDVFYCGPVDAEGVFRYSSSGASGDTLVGVVVRGSAPGFLPVESFVPADHEGRFDNLKLVLVLEESSRALAPEHAPP
jgi:hypothetical protein